MRWLFPWVLVAAVASGIVLTVTWLTGDEPLQVRSVAVGQDTRVLEVTYLGPPPECYASTRVTVEENATTVELRAWATDPQDGTCPAIARLITGRVQLDRDLGQRVVLDGRNGQPVTVIRQN